MGNNPILKMRQTPGAEENEVPVAEESEVTIAEEKEVPVAEKTEVTVVEQTLPQNEKNVIQNIDQLNLDEGNREDYHNNVDILFVLDTTSSMGSYIAPAIKTIKSIVESFSKMEFNIKFSLCTYRDHPPQDTSYVFQFHQLTSDKQMVEILSTVTVAGGGDYPEAVMDGLREGISQTKWRVGDDEKTPSKRFLFHICDAPPHGNEYGHGSSDSSWSQEGCPCGTNRNHIGELLKNHNVLYNLIKADDRLNIMESLFKQSFNQHYSETIQLDLMAGQTSSNPFVSSSVPCVSYSLPSVPYPTSIPIIAPSVHHSVKFEEKYECRNLKETMYDLASEELMYKQIESFDHPVALSSISSSALQMQTKECENTKVNMWDGVVNAIHKRL